MNGKRYDSNLDPTNQSKNAIHADACVNPKAKGRIRLEDRQARGQSVVGSNLFLVRTPSHIAEVTMKATASGKLATSRSCWKGAAAMHYHGAYFTTENTIT